MRIVNRSAIVPYTAQAMFGLVNDVQAYPEFLPWCTASAVQTSTLEERVASLTIGYGAFNSEFTTRNRFAEPQWMTMQLVTGPFSSLEGRWNFQQLGDAGCEISLQIAFDFSSAVQDMLLGPAFEKICNELIDAFIRRAHALYDSFFMNIESPMAIEVACATPAKQLVVRLEMQSGTTARQAVNAAGFSSEFPELDIGSLTLGIYGEVVTDEHVLQSGDRVEIYRPLIHEPREQRRLEVARARKSALAKPKTSMPHL